MSSVVVEIKNIKCFKCKKSLNLQKGFLPRFIDSQGDVLLSPRIAKITCPKCFEKQEVPELYKNKDEVVAIIGHITLFGCAEGEFFQVPSNAVNYT